jgi:predicted RNA-binding Zn-ribbon protein involved in translation (DUF1610 family)
MNLGDNFNDSFNYAKKLLSDVGRLVILIVLGIIPIVGLIVLGYEARVLKESPGTGNPPKLEKYGELFVDGLKVLVAILIYLVVPLILIIVGGFGTFAGLMSLQSQAVGAGFLVGGAGLIVLIVGLILGLALLIVLDVGLAHMIKTGKFGKAFAFGEIFGVIRGIGWVKYLAWIVITLVIGIVLFVITRVPFIGWLISAIIQPIFGVFVFRSLGLLYNDGAPPGLKAQAPVVTTANTCASCGTPLQPHHKFCPNCGAPVPTPPPSPPPAAEPATKYCISCGAKIPSTATFCGTCGAKQT